VEQYFESGFAMQVQNSCAHFLSVAIAKTPEAGMEELVLDAMPGIGPRMSQAESTRQLGEAEVRSVSAMMKEIANSKKPQVLRLRCASLRMTEL
jgi:hypothetical protein